jgi:hypothetical protein
MVRNDDHCPICRRYYVSIHKTLEETYEEIVKCMTDEFKSEQLEDLKQGKSLWVDEWVRRRNGDSYQILKIIPEKIYCLNDHVVTHPCGQIQRLPRKY